MTLALLSALLVRVEVLGLLHPGEAWIEGAAKTLHAVAEGDAVRLDGGAPAPEVRLGLHGPGAAALRVRVVLLQAPREFDGVLILTARRGTLLLVNEVRLEAYVAGVVAAELSPDAPEAAAAALAVVARSFAVRRTQERDRPGAFDARPGLHAPHPAGAGLCDQTHCQVYAGHAPAPARQAAARTEGEVLLLASGRVAPALHHAACGGRTSDTRDVWPAADDEEAEAGAAVDDPLPGSVPASRRPGAPPGIAPRELAACGELAGEAPLRWTVALSEAQLGRALGLTPPLGVTAETGRGGLLRLLHAPGLGKVSAEELHLRLGRALGWDVVRSPRFTFEESPPEAGGGPAASAPRTWTLHGSGHGHGVGLCQRGAVALATRGAAAHLILARYFPRLRIGPLPRGPETR